MAKLSLKQLDSFVSTLMANAVVAGAWDSDARQGTLTTMLEKIGKQVIVDGIFTDKLPEFDSETLELGKNIEEIYPDLPLPTDYDGTGADENSPTYPTYRPAQYSYELPRKVIATTIKNNEYERYCNSPEMLGRLVNMVTKRLFDAQALYKYGLKKGLICKVATLIDSIFTNATQIAVGTAVAVGSYVKNSTNYGVAVKGFTPAGASATAAWTAAIAAGNIIALNNLKETVIKPIDTITGETFIQAVKDDVEKAQFVSEGNSLNGNTVGVSEEGLMLITLPGIKSVLSTQVLAGAFNKDELGLDVEVKVVDDFGDYTGSTYAILVDKRAMKLHPTYQALRTKEVASGDYINFFLHSEFTPYFSKNCFIKVYKNN